MAILDIVIRARNQASGPVGEVQTSIDGLKRSAAAAVTSGLSPLKIALGNLAANYAAQAINRLTGAIRNLLGNTITTASDIEEMTSAFNVAFGSTAESARAELTKLADEMKRAPTEFMRYGVAFQNIFVPLGYGREEAAKMSTQLTALTSDLASFHNVAEEDVLQNLRSGIVGEHEALRKFGIVITETSLKQELMNMGAGEMTGAMLEQAKVQARLNIIMRATVDAQGDAIRTAGSFANSMRGLQAVLLDVRAGIGEKLLPAITPFIQTLTEFLRDVGPKFVEWFGTVLDAVQQWAIDVGLKEKLDAAGQWVAAFGETMGRLKDIFWQAATQGVVFEDSLAGLPPGLASVANLIGAVIIAVRDFALWIWDITKPLREWIANNVTLNDVLIALGGWIVWLAAGPLAGILTTLVTVAAAFGASVLVVTLLRKAWETDFLGIRTAFDAVVLHFKLMWGVLVQAFQEHGGAALKEIWTFVTTGKAEFTQLSLLLGDIGFIFRHTWDKLVGFVQTSGTAIAQSLYESGDSIWQLLGLRATLIVSMLFNTFNSFFEMMGQLWKTATGNDLNILNTALEAIWHVVTSVLDVLTFDIVAFLSVLSFLFQAGTAALQGDWSLAWEYIKLAFWEVTDAIRYTWDQTLGKLIDYLAEHWPAWSAKLGEWAGAAWEWLTKTAIPNTITQLGIWWNAFSGWFTEHWPTWSAKLSEWAGAAWEWLTKTAIPNTVTQLGKWWDEFSGWFTKNAPEWKKKWDEWVETATAALKEVAKAAFEVGGPGWKIDQWLTKNFPESTQQAITAWERLGEVFSEVMNEINIMFNDESNKTLLIFDALLSIVINTTATLIEQFIRMMEVLLQLITGDWGRALNTLGEFFQTWVRLGTEEFNSFSHLFAVIMEDAGQKGGGGFRTGLEASQGDAKSAVGNFADTMTQEMKDKLEIRSPSAVFGRLGALTGSGFLDSLTETLSINKLRAVGTDVLNGLVTGLTSGPEISRILDAMKDVARRALQALKDTFGVHSPSAEAFDVMQFFVAGAVLGVRKNEAKLASALNNMAAGALTGFQDTMASADAFGMATLQAPATAMRASATSVLTEKKVMQIAAGNGIGGLVARLGNIAENLPTSFARGTYSASPPSAGENALLEAARLLVKYAENMMYRDPLTGGIMTKSGPLTEDVVLAIQRLAAVYGY